MENLLKETIEVLQSNKKDVSDVIWCGSKEFGRFDWIIFALLSNKDYDSGFGSQLVAKDLLIVGKDFWLERHEYDGSEWWEFKSLPAMPKFESIPNKIISDKYSGTLEEISKE